MTNATNVKTKGAVSITYSRPNVFYPMRDSGVYLYTDNPLQTLEPVNISLPINIDTEFATLRKAPWLNAPRTHITTQVRGIKDATEVIVQNPNIVRKYPVVTEQFHGLDYLKQLGYEVSCRKVRGQEDFGLPRLQVVMYAFFALAELNMVFSGEMLECILHMQRETSEELARIEMRRRVRTVTGKGYRAQDHVQLPFIVTIDGIDYALEISIIDTGAVLGMSSYKDLCEVAGVKLTAKDNFSSEEKGRMLEMFETRFDEFDAYARGDLFVYDALKGWSEKDGDIHRALQVEDYYSGQASLTIGSTIAKLIGARNAKHMGIPSDDTKALRNMTEALLKPASASELRCNPRDTKALLSKVEGGRCINNRPTTARSFGVGGFLVDLDISGCYGEGQRVQLYPFGLPEVVSYPAKSQVNHYWTLREFLKVYKGELVSGLWFARVSTEQPLKYAQDYFASWVLPGGAGADLLSRYAVNLKSDTELTQDDEDDTFDEEKGGLKIFLREIHNATLTHDSLDYILKVCSARVRNELLDGLYIKAAMVYPASTRYDTVEALQEAKKQHKGRNKVRRVKGKLQAHDGEFHGWTSVSLADHYIDDLLANRKLHPKKEADGTKNPMNAAFKLAVNTSYGDMTSKHFELANTCVGNNITARARALAFYMEKGLIGFQTVTDGCFLDPNRVLYPGTRGVNTETLVDIGVLEDRDINRARMNTGCIAGYDRLEALWPEMTITTDKGKEVVKKYVHIRGYKDGQVTLDLPPVNKGSYVIEPARAWIDRTAMEHLQMVFPGVDVLHETSTSIDVDKELSEPGEPHKVYTPRKGQFEFEVKDFYSEGLAIHGSANYLGMHANSKDNKLAMRSYESKKKHTAITFETGNIAVSSRYNDIHPGMQFMASLLSDPGKVQRSEPFIKSGMVKPGLYKTQKRFQMWGLVPGDDYIKSGMLREFSLSQFKFNSFEQWRAWEKWYSRSKEKYGQSCEEWYLNEDGTLNYQQMIDAVYGYIREGREKPYEIYRDTERAQSHTTHPHHNDLTSLRTFLAP